MNSDLQQEKEKLTLAVTISEMCPKDQRERLNLIFNAKSISYPFKEKTS